MAKTKVGVGWLLMLVAAVAMLGMVVLQPKAPEAANWGDKDFQNLFGTTATIADLNRLHSSTATAAEINYLTGVTSNVQTQLNTLNSGKLVNTLTHQYIFVGSASNVPTGVAVSGDATIANTGAITLGAGVVNSSKIANSTITVLDMDLVTVFVNIPAGDAFKNTTVTDGYLTLSVSPFANVTNMDLGAVNSSSTYGNPLTVIVNGTSALERVYRAVLIKNTP